MPRYRANSLSLLICLTLLSAASVGSAQQDRNLPLDVRAAAVNIDEKSGVAVYSGKVILTQGSMRLEADRLEVHTDKDRRIKTVIATGRPARLRGLLENRNEELQAEAERIVYQATAREIEMTGKVWARQGADEFRAQHIVYGIDSKQLSAKGSGEEDGRVHIIFQPKAEPDKP